ncbi:peptide ABC transporter substrate-binding protein [Oscillochloris sp. ZM17-4]|uniref:peptide ABC transporter substrate-binding protein n=1 Tax=Oscillochloris sp. ZM17-4 TaxID=2866714 RepID=UPI001C72B7BB|nr:peptide ABC transporter substrate-binding protein [Oscillochloris sp. ZM17-4]MBX0330623.1 peptide ABC transporter substrate-binding protein [Oscillochloris sp. ZM17-4]
MARRIRWQIVIAALSILLVSGLLGRLALRNASVANPLSGGSYREAVLGAPAQPIPLLNDPLADPVGRDMGALLFDGLMRIGADGLPEPGLAESYEIDQSGLVYTFRLRRDVTWHDGAPLGADDVIFTLRALQSATQPGDPAAARAWQDVLVDRIDDYTVRCTLPAPQASFLSLARAPILPAHLLAGTPPEQWADTGYGSTLVGTGPFSLTELREDGATLTANPRYFGGRPYLDTVELRFIATHEAALSALTRGDVLAYGERASLDGGAAQSLATISLAGRLRRSSVPLDEYAALSFNLRSAPLDDQPLRQALAHGLSKDALIERALGGLAAPIDTPILPGSWAASPDARWYSADPATAERLLGELGYDRGVDGVRQRDGRRLSLDLIVDGEPRRRAAADEIARQWGDIGVEVKVEELPAADLLQRLRDHDFTLAIHSWARIGPDPDPYALWHSSQALNYAGLADPEIDSLLEGARAEGEIGARSSDYTAFQQRWIDLAPSITLYQPLYVFATEQSLGGVGMAEQEIATSQLLFGAEDRYRTITRWFINSYREIQGDLRSP